MAGSEKNGRGREQSERMAKILLAEDDESMRMFLAGALRRAGHEVEACGDGLEALQALESDHYELLLADIVMPGMDGIELACRAAEQLSDLKVLFITGFAVVASNARKAGGPREAKVLSKPFHLRELVHQVEKILAA